MDFIKRIWLRANRMGLLNWIPDRIFIKITFYLRVGKTLNLNHPVTFNEKIQWLKLNDHNDEYSRMVDKYETKKFVANIIGEQHIIPTLGVWDNFDNIDFEQLPNSFVLKCTHDSGGVVICKDKTRMDMHEARDKINNCMKKNYYYWGREWPYKNVKPRIIAEKYLVDESGYELRDYKVWCFNGKPTYIQFISGRNSDNCEERFYNSAWESQDFYLHNSLMTRIINRPKCLDELLNLSGILAEGKPFVRIDFYVLDSRVLFGEITFYPMSGMERWNNSEIDKKFGDLIELNIT